MIAPADIDSLERSIVAAVAPERVVEIGGWLAPLDPGPITRAKSAVPLTHAADPEAIADVEQIYLAARLAPAFRLADTEGLAETRAELARRGYVAHSPTIMKLGTAAGLAALSEDPAKLLERPDESWAEAFHADVAGDRRAQNLTRSPDALFAAVRDGARTVAVGVVTFGHGWAGVHGMRTAPDQRKRGHASRILSAFGRAAAARGVERFALQVTEDNPARGLYRGAGFTLAWRYRYWTEG